MRLINPVRCIIRPLVPLPLVSYPRAATKNKSFINSRCLVTTRSSPSLPSFTKTGNFDNSHTCDYLHNSSINGRNVEHQPNDQRTLQLGKSMFDLLRIFHRPRLTSCSSNQNASLTSPKPTCVTSSARHPLSGYHTSSFPLDSSTSSDCIGSNSVHRRTMDGSSSMGQSSCRR